MSVKSMTGYGRATQNFNGREICIDIKSVNHRYFDFSSKISKDYIYLEEKIKSAINSSVSRGKIDFYLFIDSAKESGYDISINEEIASGYVNAFKYLSKKFKIKNDLTSTFFSKIPDVIKLKKKEVDETELTEQVLLVLSQALESYNSMRFIEGEKLAQYVNENLIQF